MKATIGIVGAGVIGRTLAWRMQRQGCQVTLFNERSAFNPMNASTAAGGMLAPLAELEQTELPIAVAGMRSLDILKTWLWEFEQPIFFAQKGTIVLASKGDESDLERVRSLIAHKVKELSNSSPFHTHILDQKGIVELEPELENKFGEGLYFPSDAHFDNQEYLRAVLQKTILDGTRVLDNTLVQKINPHEVVTSTNTYSFDYIFDCRGYGAKEDLPNLRAVRGELLTVQCKDLNFTRPIRLLHPRYPIYIVPRPQNIYFIGATAIESDDTSCISVRSTLELLSSAYYVHPAFGQAEVMDFRVGLRPAFVDNLPKISWDHKNGIVRINGIYRHGYLLSPAIVEETIQIFNSNQPNAKEVSFYARAD